MFSNYLPLECYKVAKIKVHNNVCIGSYAFASELIRCNFVMDHIT